MDYPLSHKRNFSSNFIPVQHPNSHKRSNSSQKSIEKPISMPTKEKPYFFPQDSLNSPEKSPSKPQNSGFLSHLNSYTSHFSQKPIDCPILFFDDTESLKLQIDELQIVKQNLEKNNKNLENECETLENTLKTQINSKKEFENSLSALGQYMQGLEKALIKVQNELSLQKSQNDLLVEEISKTKKPLLSVSGKKKGTKSGKIVEKPKPQPIYYKPLSQRSLRNSRESSFNAGIKK